MENIDKASIGSVETNATDTQHKDTVDIKLQQKVFAILLMLFAALLFFALISYNEKDSSNIQFQFKELLGLFSNNSEIKYKLDTSVNFLGLFGAYISDLLINGTIGLWIIPFPLFLFLWGFQLNKFGIISQRIVTATTKYLLFAALISIIMGSLANFAALQFMPTYCYGAIGAFIGSIVSSVISPIGASILFIAILFLLIAKFTNIKKNGILNTLKKVKKSINMSNIIDSINAIVASSDAKPEKTIQYATTYPDANAIPLITTIAQPEKKKEILEEVIQEPEPEPIQKIAPIPTATTNDNLITNFTEPDIPAYPYKEPLHSESKTMDNEALLKEFKGNVKLKINNNPLIEQKEELNEPVAEPIVSEPVVIEDAVFTYEPPKDIVLPKPAVYVPDTEADEETKYNVIPNQPIEIDIPKPIPIATIAPIPKKIELDESNMKTIKNPLSVGILDENIKYTSPGLDLLEVGPKENFAGDDELQHKGAILQEKLETFNISISNLEATRGPVVTQYEFVPAAGVKLSKIESLADDLAMALRAPSVHIIAPVPGKGTVGIQVPNSNPSVVSIRSVVSSPEFINSNMELPLALGKTVAGSPYIADLAKMPHLLIAGSTGSGKSVGINTIITSLLYKKHPSQLKFVIIDPKKVELTHYAELSRHFLAVSPDLNTEIVTDPQDAITVLKATVAEMEKRYSILEIAKQRNIKDYNQKVREGVYRNDPVFDHRALPYIVVVVDELADLMLTAGKEIELPIVRLAQMSRAIGIHIIIATQRPSVNVITGIIKANFPARIAYLVAQKVDSRTILDAGGADALLGNGDMLYNAGNQALRIQNPFISTEEVERVCNFIREQDGYSMPYMLPSTSETKADGNNIETSGFDPLFREAAELIINTQQASTSMLQRRMKIGFARAGRIMDELESARVIGPQQGSKPRAIMMESIYELESLL
ncbi:MAG: DNA translocase FtsK [Ignavibacteria bacterium]|nr:DNA translocase FtsK [Ignavibacteria bacterium]